MSPLVPLSLALCFAGCVSIQALRTSVGDTLAAQGDIVDGLAELDTICQQRANSHETLIACRVPRDKVRDALRRQVASLARLGGAQ